MICLSGRLSKPTGGEPAVKNTWQKEISTEVLYDLKDEYAALVKARPFSSVIKRYFDDFRISYIYNTNAIEGSPITHTDTAFIVNSGAFLESYTALQNMEVLGGNKAWDYILTLPALTWETATEIHRRILFFDEENAGKIRKVPVHVGDKQMPEGEVIKEGLKKLFQTDREDLFSQMALTHLRFENLHPFIDGNGRVGRMIMNLQLMATGFLPVNIKYNEAAKYYRCFRQYDISTEKGVQELYNLISKYEHEELRKIIEMIKT